MPNAKKFSEFEKWYAANPHGGDLTFMREVFEAGQKAEREVQRHDIHLIRPKVLGPDNESSNAEIVLDILLCGLDGRET